MFSLKSEITEINKHKKTTCKFYLQKCVKKNDF